MTDRVADRVRALRPTAVNKVLAEVKRLQAEGRDLVSGATVLNRLYASNPTSDVIACLRELSLSLRGCKTSTTTSRY